MPENNNIVNVNIDIEPIREAVIARLEQEIHRLEENMNTHAHFAGDVPPPPIAGRELTEEELPEPTETFLTVHGAGGVAGAITANGRYFAGWDTAPTIRIPTYRCNGCGEEKQGMGYVSIRNQNVEICEPCSAQMFKWMVSRSKSAILNQ